MAAPDKKKIVVIGAGFGGLRAALRIGRKLNARNFAQKYEVILVDKNGYQTFTPLLYALAGAPEKGAILAPRITYDIPSLVKNTSITFIEDEVESADLSKGDLHLKKTGELCAEFVVIAIGSEINYFGIPGLRENSLPLKTLEDARKIGAEIVRLKALHPRLRVLVGGAGPNGIEFASELKQSHPDFDVCIVEAMPAILPGLDIKVAARAAARLKKLGIAVRLNAKISAASAGKIALDGGETVPFDLFVWTGGVKGSELLAKFPLHAEHGRPLASGEMLCLPQTPELKLASMVYGLGDAVCFTDKKTGRPVPAIAPAAMAQADVVAHNVIEEIKYRETPSYKLKTKTYVPKEFPYVIPMGKNWAVAKIGPFVIAGRPGHWFKDLVELDYLISVMPLARALRTLLPKPKEISLRG